MGGPFCVPTLYLILGTVGTYIKCTYFCRYKFYKLDLFHFSTYMPVTSIRSSSLICLELSTVRIFYFTILTADFTMLNQILPESSMGPRTGVDARGAPESINRCCLYSFLSLVLVLTPKSCDLLVPR